MEPEPVRTLPLRVPAVPGEALDSWLCRLAYRNQVPARDLAAVLGLRWPSAKIPGRAFVSDLNSQALRRIEQQAGLRPGTLDSTVLSSYTTLGWPTIPGSRYCVACVTEDDHPWPIRWRLPYVFACTRHQLLLVSSCPSCQQMPKSRWSRGSGLNEQHICALPASSGVCGADLRTQAPKQLQARDPRLAAQQWINQKLDDRAGVGGDDLRELHRLASWLRLEMLAAALALVGEDTASVFTGRGPTPVRKTQQDIYADAATATVAFHILTAEELLEYHARRLLEPTLGRRTREPAQTLHRLLSIVPADKAARLLAQLDRELPPSTADGHPVTTTDAAPHHRTRSSANVADDESLH